jgi:peptide maturation system protein (TIGR04066 family)
MDIYRDLIEVAKSAGKEIILTDLLANKLGLVNMTARPQESFVSDPETDRLHEISVPVITVLSQGYYADQLAVTLALRKHFKDISYNVAQVGHREYAKLFGYTPLPDFLYEPLDAYDKILWFNQFVDKLTIRTQAELLIINVPDPIMKFNQRVLHGLGVLPYVICQGVRSDLTVLCLHYHPYTQQYFDKLTNYCHYHLDCSETSYFFNIANLNIEPDDTTEERKPKHIDLESAFVLQSIADMNIQDHHLFNALDIASVMAACEAVQQVLTNNAHYM